MKKFISLCLISIPFILLGQFLPAEAGIKAGSACKKAGETSTVSGKTFRCINLGKKLVWDNGISGASTNAYTVPSVPSSNINLCKIPENNDIRKGTPNALATGFPTVSNLAQKMGTVKWALVPIDFTDVPGEANFRSRVNDQMLLLSEWYRTVSEGKFNVEWVVADKWTTLPAKSTDYKIPFSDGPDRSPAIADFWTKAITEADKNFDFTNIETVNFILPLKQTVVTESLQGFPWEQAVKNYLTNEGKVSSFSVAGVFLNQLNRQYWSYWAHEFGHAMGMPHIGSSRIPNSYMGLDLLSNQDGYTKELSGWMRFVAGWLDDEKVYCQEFSKLASTELTLAPLSSTKSGIKMAVVPVSETKAVIVESRRETKFSCKMPSKKDGVLVYIYDATLGHGENFLTPATPMGRNDEGSSNCPVSRYPDPLLYKGQKINVQGVTVEVLESLNYDRVRLSKTN